MRYYIEAFGSDDQPILGNLDGQAGLGDVHMPWRTTAWRRLGEGPPIRPTWSRVKEWHLVDEKGNILRHHKNQHAHR